MDELEQKQAAQHLDLYRADGRSYDLREEDGVLTLQLRRSLLWEKSIVWQLPLLLGVVLLPFKWATGNVAPFVFMDWAPPIFMAMTAYIKIRRRIRWGETWKFDKASGSVHHNQQKTHKLSQIQRVRAWRRGRKYHVSLQLRYGQTLKLGRFAFARSERAWRDDAAQIAAFLGVPLEIPPVFD